MLPDNKTRICPYSKKAFIPKRENQIFASANYRIAYNNKLNNAFRKKLNIINKELIKNYKLLDKLLAEQKEITINKYYLRGGGFSFKTFTHISFNQENIVYGLYDVCFQKLNNDEYLIYRTR